MLKKYERCRGRDIKRKKGEKYRAVMREEYKE